MLWLCSPVNTQFSERVFLCVWMCVWERVWCCPPRVVVRASLEPLFFCPLSAWEELDIIFYYYFINYSHLDLVPSSQIYLLQFKFLFIRTAVCSPLRPERPGGASLSVGCLFFLCVVGYWFVCFFIGCRLLLNLYLYAFFVPPCVKWKWCDGCKGVPCRGRPPSFSCWFLRAGYARIAAMVTQRTSGVFKAACYVSFGLHVLNAL